MANADEIIFLNAINCLEEVERDALKERRIFQSINPFDLSDSQFVKLFRLSKEVTLELCENLRYYLTPPSRSSALDIQRKILISLKFFASGSYQTDVGYNLYTGVSQASVSRCVTEVCNALNEREIFQNWVKFPSSIEELRETRTGFYEKFHFPGVVGVIDCTHIAIIAPKENENVFVNRKNYHSINVQLVCDSNMNIIHACARYPGSTHDSYIWNNSSLKEYFINLHDRGETNFFLLGDSGYALRTYLMTPITNPEPEQNTPEYRYNVKQMSTRTLIERCNGLLKMRFRCLLKHRTLHYNPQTACKIINACIVLHNICITNNIDLPEDVPEGDLDLELGLMGEHNFNEDIIGRVNPDLAKGRAFRENLINTYFN